MQGKIAFCSEMMFLYKEEEHFEIEKGIVTEQTIFLNVKYSVVYLCIKGIFKEGLEKKNWKCKVTSDLEKG